MTTQYLKMEYILASERLHSSSILQFYCKNHSGKIITFKGFFEQILVKRKLNVIEIIPTLKQTYKVEY
jgi:hypothetical protein